MDKPDLAAANARRWTRIDTYMEALARRGAARRRRQIAARTEPETPRLMLSTVPFIATMSVLAVLIVLFAVAAWPASQPEFRPKPVQKEMGTAQRGWFQEAQKEFR
jgi:hypothetical protein